MNMKFNFIPIHNEDAMKKPFFLTNILILLCMIGLGAFLAYMCYETGKLAGKLEYLEEEHALMNVNWYKENRIRKTFEMGEVHE